VEGEQEAVVLGNPPGQSLAKLLLGRLDALMGEGGQPGRISLAGNHRLKHGPAALAKHVAEQAGDLDIGLLQRLVDALHVPRLVANQLLARAHQGAQLLGGNIGNKARPDQAVREELPQPCGIVHVALATRHILHVRRIGQHQGKIFIARQHLPDRLPVDAGRLHDDVSDAVLRQPIQQLQQTFRGRGKNLRVGGHLAFLRNANTGHN
jgi:hypothetical protein